MGEQYLIMNGPAPTTAAQAVVQTSATLATLLQLKLGSTLVYPRPKIIEWGVSFDGSAAATPFKVELLANTVAATVTAHVAAGIVNRDPKADAPTDGFPFDVGTSATGFTSSAEGTPANVRMFDAQLIAPTNQYVKQFPLGQEPSFTIAEFVRIRVWGDGSTNAYAYIVVDV